MTRILFILNTLVLLFFGFLSSRTVYMFISNFDGQGTAMNLFILIWLTVVELIIMAIISVINLIFIYKSKNSNPDFKYKESLICLITIQVLPIVIFVIQLIIVNIAT